MASSEEFFVAENDFFRPISIKFSKICQNPQEKEIVKESSEAVVVIKQCQMSTLIKLW